MGKPIAVREGDRASVLAAGLVPLVNLQVCVIEAADLERRVEHQRTPAVSELQRILVIIGVADDRIADAGRVVCRRRDLSEGGWRLGVLENVA